jgi:hypothetical protein
MKYRTRIQYSETDKPLMWGRWEGLPQDYLANKRARRSPDLLFTTPVSWHSRGMWIRAQESECTEYH